MVASNSGNFVTLTVMRRASSRVSNLAADRRPGVRLHNTAIRSRWSIAN